MKKSYNFRKTIGRKNLILSLVALILILMTAVSASISWIEEVSNVVLDPTNGQNTPLHIDNGEMLKSDVITAENNQTTVDLNKYFHEAGNMHLSGCYSDGKDFWFPKKNTNTNSASNYRNGNKDDANVNYISTTFRVQSANMATSFWLEHLGTTLSNQSNTIFVDTDNKKPSLCMFCTKTAWFFN